MEKNYSSMDFTNPIKCEVCGRLNYADDYGNTDKCPHCGWISCPENNLLEEWYGISYPMLVPLSRAREQYKTGQKFKASFEDFINGLKWYKEMLFWYKGLCYPVYWMDYGICIWHKDDEKKYATIEEFIKRADVTDGKLLKDIWDEVVHPCFMYCGGEHDYDVPPED